MTGGDYAVFSHEGTAFDFLAALGLKKRLGTTGKADCIRMNEVIRRLQYSVGYEIHKRHFVAIWCKFVGGCIEVLTEKAAYKL